MKRWYQFLALCIALCLLAACGTSAQGKPQAEGGTGSNNSVDNGLLDGASPETSALSLYEWDGNALTVHTLYETDYVTEILKELRNVPVSDASDWSPEQLTTPVYGLWISKADGSPLEAVWSGGVWIDRDGMKYSFDYPFHELLARYTWDDSSLNSIAFIPCARYLAEYDGTWYPGFMARAEEPAAPEGVTMELTEQTSEMLTVTYSNQSGTEWDYGTYFHLDVEIDDAYYTVPTMPGTNWAFEDIGIILPDGETQTRQYDLTRYGILPDGDYRISANGLSTVFTIGEKTLDEYHQPPDLIVSCGDHYVPASGTTYSWSYPNGDGTSCGVEADGMHPLEMLEYMTPLTVDRSGDVALEFELEPDEIIVHCWPEAYALESEDYDAFIKHLDEALTLPVERGHVTVPTDGNYVYEVYAKWNAGGDSGGNGYFGFWTAADSDETIQAEPEPPSTMPMPMGRDPDAIKAYLATFPNGAMNLADRGDVILLLNAEETDWTLWNRFEEAVQAGNEAAVVVIGFTVEGDAIPMYLHFDGTDFYMMEDSTRDAFGSGAFREMTYASLEDVRQALGIEE